MNDSLCPVWVQNNGQVPANPAITVNSDGSITATDASYDDIPDAYSTDPLATAFPSQRFLIVITFSVRVTRSSATTETLSPLLDNQRYELMFGTCTFEGDTIVKRIEEIEFTQVTAIKEMEPILTIPDPTTIFTLQT